MGRAIIGGIVAGILIGVAPWPFTSRAQGSEPTLYRVIDVPPYTSANTVYWFETAGSECYVLTSTGYCAGISCLRKERP